MVHCPLTSHTVSPRTPPQIPVIIFWQTALCPTCWLEKCRCMLFSISGALCVVLCPARHKPDFLHLWHLLNPVSKCTSSTMVEGRGAAKHGTNRRACCCHHFFICWECVFVCVVCVLLHVCVLCYCGMCHSVDVCVSGCAWTCMCACDEVSVQVSVCNHMCVWNALVLMYVFTVLFCTFMIVVTVLVLFWLLYYIYILFYSTCDYFSVCEML